MVEFVRINKYASQGLRMPSNTSLPYVSFRSLLTTLDKLSGVPSSDSMNTVLSGTYAPSYRAQMLAALTSLGFAAMDGQPTPLLLAFANGSAPARRGIIKELLEAHYSVASGLRAKGATRTELEELFGELTGLSGTTLRKTVSFFLAAQRYAFSSADAIEEHPPDASVGSEADSPLNPRGPVPLLRPGHELKGLHGTYFLRSQIGSGSYGHTYMAVRLPAGVDQGAGGGLSSRRTQVVKIPAIDRRRPFPDIVSRLALVASTLSLEYASLQRLAHPGSRGVAGDRASAAPVLDFGTVEVPITQTLWGEALVLPVPFIVYGHVEGRRLDKYLEHEFSPSGPFRGIPDERRYGILAKELAKALVKVHRSQVIHGDIWPENIIIQSSDGSRPNAVFIDFGQALFRDLAFGESLKVAGTHPYVAPEGIRSVGADVYALGGVLFYMATGEHPPTSIRNFDNLKRMVTDRIKHWNRALYESNGGVVDVIVRCLADDLDERTPHAEGVLYDLDTFFGPELEEIEDSGSNEPRISSPALVPEIRRLQAVITDLLSDLENEEVPGKVHPSATPAFASLLSWEIASLRLALTDMRKGVHDLLGSREILVGGLTRYLSFLNEGDSFLTVSVPWIWNRRNLGPNGRVLTMNKLAVLRGATIRRVFLATLEDRRDSDFRRVVTGHLRALEEVSEAGFNVDDPDPERGGFFAGYYEVTEAQREHYRQQGRHFGLLTKDGQEILVFPGYTQKRQLVSLQFRVGVEDQTNRLKRAFEDLLPKAQPLSNLL